MGSVSVRYIVRDVDEAIEFYSRRLGFTVVMHPAPTFAILALGDFHLMLSAPEGPGGGARAAADGSRPEPGGWNRIQIEVGDVEAETARLRKAGVRFRTDLITGVGARQVLVEDPSGNPVELFERLGG